MTVATLISCADVGMRPLPGYQVPEFELSHPAKLMENIGAIQKVNISANGHDYHYEGLVEISPDSIKVLLLHPWGQRIATLNYDGSEFWVVRERGASVKLPFRRMLGVMQQIFWPERTVAKQQGDAVWRVIDTEHMREIYYNHQLTGIVEYDRERSWTSNVIYWDIPYNYRVTINSVQLN